MAVRLSLFLVLCGSLFATAASARDTLVLAPSSPWNLRYEEDRCRLVRMYGEGEERVELNIIQSGDEPFFNLFIVGRRAKANGRGAGLSVQFGPDEEELERSFIHGSLGDEKLPFLMMYGIQLGTSQSEEVEVEFANAGIGEEREGRIEWLAVGGRSAPALRLQLPGFSSALTALKACSEDLVLQLGLDPNGQLKVAEPAKMTNQIEVARSIQYPQVYVMESIEGSVKVRMTINKDGKATNCQIARSSRPAVFDDVVCLAMMQKGEFEAAVDNEGNRTASFVIMKFSFQLD